MKLVPRNIDWQLLHVSLANHCARPPNVFYIGDIWVCLLVDFTPFGFLLPESQ